MTKPNFLEILFANDPAADAAFEAAEAATAAEAFEAEVAELQAKLDAGLVWVTEDNARNYLLRVAAEQEA